MTDEEIKKEARKQAKLAKESARRDLHKVMELREGRRFVWRLLGSARMFEQSFTGEAMTTAFNEGKRSVANELLAELNDAAPGAFLLMLREQNATASEAKPAEDQEQEKDPDG